MTAFNIVRFRAKPEFLHEFQELYRTLPRSFEGLRKISLVKTGDFTFCGIGEWESLEAMSAARPGMIGNLDNFRHMLEEPGGEPGVTDAVSGNVVYEFVPATA